jgi:hypothetical protein
MNLNDLFPSAFLKAADLQGKEPVVTIAKVERVPMGRKRELVAVLYFKGKDRGLKLNVTLARAIAAIAGTEEVERWTGIAVQLFATTETFNKQTFPVVRVKAPGVHAQPAPRLVAGSGR